VRFDGTLPGNPTPPAVDTDDGGDSSLGVVLVVVLGVLALGGGGAGIFLARRSRNGEGKDET
jgi:hypothetical protein